MKYDRVTRTLFTLGELTLADPDYTGPFFDLDKIAKEVNDKVVFLILSFHRLDSEKVKVLRRFWTYIFLKPLPVSNIHSWLD